MTREAPESCPNCFDRTDCVNVDICKAVEGVYPSSAGSAQYLIEGIILRRLHEKRVEGYTLEMSREIAEAISAPAQAVSEPVQDTWFTDSRLPIMAASGDIENDRVIKLHFRHKVTDKDRARLIDVINAGEAALAAQPPAAPVETTLRDALIAAQVALADGGIESTPFTRDALDRINEALAIVNAAPVRCSSAGTGEPATVDEVLQAARLHLLSNRCSDADRFIARAQAMLARTQPQTLWQPIETAPKDGTQVIVWCDQGMDLACYSERKEDAPDDMGHDAGWWGVHQPMDPGRSMGAPAYTRDPENQPWAWMPQPDPPYDADGFPLFDTSLVSRPVSGGHDV